MALRFIRAKAFPQPAADGSVSLSDLVEQHMYSVNHTRFDHVHENNRYYNPFGKEIVLQRETVDKGNVRPVRNPQLVAFYQRCSQEYDRLSTQIQSRYADREKAHLAVRLQAMFAEKAIQHIETQLQKHPEQRDSVADTLAALHFIRKTPDDFMRDYAQRTGINMSDVLTNAHGRQMSVLENARHEQMQTVAKTGTLSDDERKEVLEFLNDSYTRLKHDFEGVKVGYDDDEQDDNRHVYQANNRTKIMARIQRTVAGFRMKDWSCINRAPDRADFLAEDDPVRLTRPWSQFLRLQKMTPLEMLHMARKHPVLSKETMVRYMLLPEMEKLCQTKALSSEELRALPKAVYRTFAPLLKDVYPVRNPEYGYETLQEIYRSEILPQIDLQQGARQTLTALGREDLIPLQTAEIEKQETDHIINVVRSFTETDEQPVVMAVNQ